MDYHIQHVGGGISRVQFKRSHHAHANARAHTDAVDHLRPRHRDARAGNRNAAADSHARPARAYADAPTADQTGGDETTADRASRGGAIANRCASVFAWDGNADLPGKRHFASQRRGF